MNLKIGPTDLKKLDYSLGGDGQFKKCFDLCCELMGIKAAAIKILVRKSITDKLKIDYAAYHCIKNYGCLIKIAENMLENPSWVIQMVLHELTHQKQSEDGTLAEPSYKTKIWLGDLYKIPQSLTKEEYNNLPWEKDARFVQFYYCNHILCQLGLEEREDMPDIIKEVFGGENA